MLTKPFKRPLIGLIAPCMGSGKTAVATALCLDHGFKRLGFADTGKRMVEQLLISAGLSLPAINDHVYGAKKNDPIPALQGASVRHLMQTLGTDWGRKCIHQQVWADIGLTMADGIGGPVVFDDVRFLNEAMGIRLRGGFVVRITRPGAVKVNAHPSEGMLDDFAVDFSVVNDGPLHTIPALATSIINAFF